MIGHAANGTTTWGSGIEQLILQFSKTCLRPMLQRIEDAIYRDIFTPEQRKKFSVKFNMDAFLEGDSVARANFLTKMSDSGIYTKDEARAYENKPPIPGGAHAIVNGTMQRLDKIGETTTPQPQAAPQPANTNDPVPDAPKKAA
jgi:phage portal protein BeeE